MKETTLDSLVRIMRVIFGVTLLIVPFIVYLRVRWVQPVSDHWMFVYWAILPMFLFISGVGIICARSWAKTTQLSACAIWLTLPIIIIIEKVLSGVPLKNLVNYPVAYLIGVALYTYLNILFFSHPTIKKQMKLEG